MEGGSERVCAYQLPSVFTYELFSQKLQDKAQHIPFSFSQACLPPCTHKPQRVALFPLNPGLVLLLKAKSNYFIMAHFGAGSCVHR